jgi:hypothetical protein
MKEEERSNHICPSESMRRFGSFQGNQPLNNTTHETTNRWIKSRGNKMGGMAIWRAWGYRNTKISQPESDRIVHKHVFMSVMCLALKLKLLSTRIFTKRSIIMLTNSRLHQCKGLIVVSVVSIKKLAFATLS